MSPQTDIYEIYKLMIYYDLQKSQLQKHHKFPHPREITNRNRDALHEFTLDCVFYGYARYLKNQISDISDIS
jgi:hypothetical protein